MPDSSSKKKKRRVDETANPRPEKVHGTHKKSGARSSKTASSQVNGHEPISPPATLAGAEVDSQQDTQEHTQEAVLVAPEGTTHTGLHLITACLYLPLLPITQEAPLAGAVADALSPLLLTYHPPFKGFILSHHNARCAGPANDDAGSMGRVMDEYAASFVWITVDVLVFRPTRGAWLEGVVNIQNESHIGLMVWNLFNASVEKNRLPKGWKWIPDDAEPMTQPLDKIGRGIVQLQKRRRRGDLGAWYDGNGEKVEGILSFRAKDFDLPHEKDRDRGLLSIEGSLVSEERDREIDREIIQAAANGIRTSMRRS